MKKQSQPIKPIKKQASSPTVKSTSFEKPNTVHFPNWIYIAIMAFCFSLYGNTMRNEYALDDTVVLTQNEFVKEGISGIPKIFKYDTFIGRYGEQVTNLPGGRYRPLSVASLAIEYDLFAGSEIKKIIHDKLDPTKAQYSIPRHLLPKEEAAKIDTLIQGVIYTKTAPKQNDDDAPLYVQTALPYVNHFMNILLFAITACFLFKVMWRLFPVRDVTGWKLLFNVPVITTLLFVAHPVHVEAIANIKGRDEIMTFLGALMALFYTLRWLDTRNKKYLFITFLCFLSGAFSKENAITFLAVIPLTIYFCTSYKLKDNFIALLPSLIAALIFLAVRRSIITGGSAEETEFMNNPFLGMRPYEKWASTIYVLGRYLWLLIFPNPLTTDYYPHHIPRVSLDSIGVWISLVIYLALFLFMLWSMASKKKNKYGYAIVWYLIPLSVVSNVFVMIGTFMNERFIYISSVGFCLAIAYCLIKHVPTWIKNIKAYHYSVTGFLVIVVSLYSIQTISRNPDWHDDFTLSTTDVKTSYNSAKANYDAARVYNIKIQTEADANTRNFYTQQIYKYSKRAIELHPNYENALLLYAWANNTLGASPDSAAKYPIGASVQALIRAIQRNPYNPYAYNSLVIVLSRINPAQKVQIWEKVVAIAPDNFEANYNIACVYAKEMGQLSQSVPYFEKALKLNPNHVNGLIDIGAIYGQLGYPIKSLEVFEKAVSISPSDTLAWRNLWRTYEAVGNIPKAQQSYQQYMRSKNNQ